jgi:CubicO group peptidase (beta-lactamase class C family)
MRSQRVPLSRVAALAETGWQANDRATLLGERHALSPLALALTSFSGAAPTGVALAEASIPAAAKAEDVGLSPDQLKRIEAVTIYSMTKPIVSIALMQMVEEGKLQVSDPVAKYLPEFKDVKVGVEKAGAFELAAPPRPMTYFATRRA